MKFLLLLTDTFLMTGGRRKRSSGGWGTYSSIISSTASLAVNVQAGAITKTIRDTIDVNTGISFTYIANISMSVTGDVFRFPIDNRIVYFTVEVDHENSQSNIKLFRPSGTVENFLTSAATIDIVSYTTVLSIKNPVVGVWQLQKLGGSIWRVIVKGKGDISFDSQLLVEKGGIPFPMSDSSPVTGSNVIIGVTVKEIHDNSSVNKIILRTDQNEIVKEFDLGNTNKNVVHAKLFIPPQAFRITIEGSDSDGNVYRRTARNLITPVNAKIDFLSVNRGLIKGIAETVQVIVSNEGSSDDTFYVVATDSENFLQTPKQVSVFVSAHNSSVVEFKILGTRNGLTKLKVELKKRSRILQSKSEYLMVHKSTPPIITTTNQTPACTEELMNSVNCSFGTWFMETSVKCTQSCIDIHITSPIISLSPVTLNKTGIVTANISGDCCSAESKLVAVDSLSNVAELSIDFSGGHKFETIETTTTTSKIGPPNLVVVGESKACELEYMNSENCTNMNWWAEVNILFQAFANAIYASPNRSEIGNGSFAVIEHDDLKSMKKEIHANVSGSCCLYKISLFAQDNTGQLSMHQLDFSGGVQFHQIVSGNDVKEKISSAPSLVLIVVIPTCVVSVGILALIVYRLYRINHKVSFEDHVGFKNEMKQRADKCVPVKFRH